MDAFSLIATLELQADNFFSGLSGAAEAMIQFAEDCVETGMEFDASMSQVQAIALSTANVTNEQITSLSNKAKEMGLSFKQGADNVETAFNILRASAMNAGLTTVFTAQEASEALVYMGMAGWNAEEMLEGLPGVLNLAAMSGVDLGTTSDIVTDALTAFNMKAKEAVYFSDLLAMTSARANTNVDLMGQTFKYIAPVFGAYNLEAEDAALAIGLLANRGIKASQAGTSLRRILQNIAVNNGASDTEMGALDVINDMGVKFFDEDTGEIRDFSEFLADLREAWNSPDNPYGNYPLGKPWAAKKIAGQYGLTAFLSLMSASDEEFYALQQALAGCWYTAESLAEAFEKNGKNLDTLRDSMGEMGVTQEEFTQALNESHRDADAFVDSLAKLSGKSKDEIVAAMKEMGISTKELQTIFNQTAGASQTMADIMLNNLKGDVELFNDAFDYLKIIISDKLTPTLREYTQFATEGLTNVAVALQEGGWTEAAEAAVNWAKQAKEKLAEDLPGFKDKAAEITKAISSVFKELGPEVGELLGTVGSMIGEFLSENAATITTTVTSFITSLTPGIVAAVKGIGAGLREAWPEIKAGIGEMFQEWGLFKEGTFAGMIPQWIKDAAGMFGWDLTGTANQAQKELETYLLGGNKSGTPNGQPTYDLTQKGVGNQLAEKAGKPETVLDTAAQAAQDSGLSNIIEGIQNGSIIQTLVGAGETGIAALGSFLFGTKDKNKAAQAERQNQLNATLTGNAANYDPNKTYDFSDWQWTSDEGVTITANFVDNVSENAKSAIDALTDLGNLVSDDYDTTSLHTDLTSPAAKQAVHSILELLGYDGLEQFTSSYHENGASGPIEEAFMDLLTLMGYDGHEFLTSSAHDSAQAAAAILEILALITQNEAKDGSVTTTTNRQINETVNITYTQDGGKLPPLNGGNADPNMNVLNAIAMSPGRILRGATMFGWDAFGNPQIGGEVGAEAVVGVNSLDQMIQNSVNAAMSAVLGRLDALISGRSDRPLKVVLDTGALVGGIVDAMDSEMDTIAQWKAGDRA